jgi:hypothetical protein
VTEEEFLFDASISISEHTAVGWKSGQGCLPGVTTLNPIENGRFGKKGAFLSKFN